MLTLQALTKVCFPGEELRLWGLATRDPGPVGPLEAGPLSNLDPGLEGPLDPCPVGYPTTSEEGDLDFERDNTREL